MQSQDPIEETGLLKLVEEEIHEASVLSFAPEIDCFALIFHISSSDEVNIMVHSK